jgi:hypothetical protein
MTQGTPARFTTPIAETIEQANVTFDFGPLIADAVPNTSILGVRSITCAVVSGEDPTPSARLIGSPAIVPSPYDPDIPLGAVAQRFGSAIGGATYLLQCAVTLSDGQRPTLEVKMPCYTPS